MTYRSAIVVVICSALWWSFSEMKAQTADSVELPRASNRSTRTPSYVVYVELGGPAQKLFSLHAEMTLLRFRHEHLNMGVHNSIRASVGVTVLPADRIYVPVMLKYIMFEKAQHIEIGLGVSILAAEVQGYTGSSTNFPASPVLAAGSIGYRFEPLDSGIMGRIAYTPIYEFTTQEYRHGIGLSLGMAF
ncbi:MAG: hypothetical protein JSS89_07535 [Bacteroidetes bacterium]|nr:hypothetical protein [Bacteroidota bacterium]